MEPSRRLLVVAAVAATAVLGYRYVRVRAREGGAEVHAAAGAAPAPVAKSTKSFGSQTAWIAVRAASPEKLATALRLDAATRSPWSGVSRSQNRSRDVFITPPIGEWTLAVGRGLVFLESITMKDVPADRHPRKLLAYLEALSRDLGGVVQYFLTHPVAETHVWVLADGGRIVRAYGYSGERGEVLWNIGALTPAESALGQTFPERSDDIDNEGIASPDEQVVMHIAGKWSVDPTQLDTRSDVGDEGLVGSIP